MAVHIVGGPQPDLDGRKALRQRIASSPASGRARCADHLHDVDPRREQRQGPVPRIAPGMEDAHHAYCSELHLPVIQPDLLSRRRASRTPASIACPVHGLGYHTGLSVHPVCPHDRLHEKPLVHHIGTVEGSLTHEGHGPMSAKSENVNARSADDSR